MKGTCSICTEHFVFGGQGPGADVAAVPCGHTFHTTCILPWLNTKSNCPECRKAFKRNSVINKLFFNFEEHTTPSENPAALKNELDTAQCQLRLKESEKTELKNDNVSLSNKVAQMKDNIDALQLVCKEERTANQALTKELKFHKKLQTEAEVAKEEAKRLLKKLEDLKAVEAVVRGNHQEITERVQTHDKDQLATFAVIIKKELDGKRKELKATKLENLDLKKALQMKKRQLAENTSELKTGQEKLKLLEQDVAEAESRNDRLRDKITKLERALGSPSDSAVAFAHRLIHESPAPSMMPSAKKQRLSSDAYSVLDGSTDMFSPDKEQQTPDFFTSPDLPRVVTKSAKANVFTPPEAPMPVTYLKFSSSNSSQQNVKSSKSGPSDMSNVPNVSGLGNYNLFKKKTGSGLLNEGSSRIRHGFNGLGSRETHVQPLGQPFKKPTGLIKKKTNVFAKSKTVCIPGREPDLPSMNNFL